MISQIGDVSPINPLSENLIMNKCKNDKIGDKIE